jgi:branched-chain amino acid aminotransferase
LSTAERYSSGTGMNEQKALPDWDALSFRLTETEVVYRAVGESDQKPVWDDGEYGPWGSFPASPAAGVLSYGLGVFEGLKAERTPDGRILLFRPDANAARFARSARIMTMEPFPEKRFVEVCLEIVRRNERFIPPVGKGQLYVRPVEFASEPMLGLRRARSFTVVVYASPVGAYFKGADSGVRLQVLDEARVAPGGTGHAKAASNYPAGIAKREAWQAKGFDDVLFLDARGEGFVTETSGSNVFALFPGDRLVTPPLDDQILPGITRECVIRLAREEFGWTVEEKPLAIADVQAEAVEMFCSGTAWTVRSVGEIEHRGKSTSFSQTAGCQRLCQRLREIQTGTGKDPYGWITEV